MQNQKNILAGVALAIVSTLSMAALPAEATTAFTNISGAVTDVLAALWPIVAAVTAGFVMISLFKRGASKV
jgi:hypothetical protein